MGRGQFEPEIEHALGLRFEIGKIAEACGRVSVRANLLFHLAGGAHVKIVIGVNLVENLFFPLGGENRTLLVYPMVEVGAADLETFQVAVVVVQAESKDSIVQSQYLLL